MRIHVVAPFNSNAMSQLVNPLTGPIAPWMKFTVDQAPDWAADYNYYIPALGGFGTSIEGPAVAYYTHLNPGQKPFLLNLAEKCEAVACMSETGAKELRDVGVTKPIWVIPPGVEGFRPRKRNILIVGAEQPTGRKRSWLLLDLAWRYDLSPFHFVVVGTGWEDVVTKLTNMGVSVRYEPKVEADTLRDFYLTADAFLVTASVEGGPLPLLEALASGTPVITPNIGFAPELKNVIQHHTYDNADTLYVRLHELWEPVQRRADAVKPYTIARYCGLTASMFAHITGIPGEGRYGWLRRTIDDVKPNRIMEIGVAAGNSAEPMIKDALKYHDTVHYHGYDLFEDLTTELFEEEKSKWPSSEKAVYERLTKLTPHVSLIKGNTRETLALPYSGGPVPFIFVDGGHSKETIASDWQHLQRYIGPDTVIIFDDYYTDYDGPHGCQDLVHSLDSAQWKVEILPPSEYWGELTINMVRVQRRH